MTDRPEASMQLEGRFWLDRAGRPFLGPGRVALLEHIDACRSIAAPTRPIGERASNASQVRTRERAGAAGVRATGAAAITANCPSRAANRSMNARDQDQGPRATVPPDR